MSKQKKEFLMIGIGLIGLSLVLHYVHYLIFQDLHHTLIFLFADIAFIPMEVFFTTLVIDKLLEKREKEHLRDKLSMLIGVFFSELGTDILNTFFIGKDFLLKFLPLEPPLSKERIISYLILF
ncbi:MAG: hypothetical protein E7I73_12400, partial [Clostridium perfringens]|nr:hypothetical protein [Clostridium perfringens]